MAVRVPDPPAAAEEEEDQHLKPANKDLPEAAPAKSESKTPNQLNKRF